MGKGYPSISDGIKAVEKEVVDCGKTASVAAGGEFEAEVDFLTRKYPWTKFYRSKDNIITKPMGITVECPGISKISHNAVSLVESGIYSRLRKEKHERNNFKRPRAGVYKPPKESMTMDECIVTLFILCAGVAAFASIVYFVECCTHYWGKLLLNLSRLCSYTLTQVSRRDLFSCRPNPKR